MFSRGVADETEVVGLVQGHRFVDVSSGVDVGPQRALGSHAENILLPRDLLHAGVAAQHCTLQSQNTSKSQLFQMFITQLF